MLQLSIILTALSTRMQLNVLKRTFKQPCMLGNNKQETSQRIWTVQTRETFCWQAFLCTYACIKTHWFLNTDVLESSMIWRNMIFLWYDCQFNPYVALLFWAGSVSCSYSISTYARFFLAGPLSGVFPFDFVLLSSSISSSVSSSLDSCSSLLSSRFFSSYKHNNVLDTSRIRVTLSGFIMYKLLYRHNQKCPHQDLWNYMW